MNVRTCKMRLRDAREQKSNILQLYRIKGYRFSPTTKQRLSMQRMTQATRQTGHLVNRGSY